MRSDSIINWKNLGKNDPYYGVLSEEKYKMERLSPEIVNEFFKTGESFVSDTGRRIQKLFDVNIKDLSILDFGCGVGRLAIPFAKASEKQVCGIDVSPDIIDRAIDHQRALEVKNLIFKTYDGSNLADIGMFDCINSYIVFQHIEPANGMALLSQLLQKLRVGGIMQVQLTHGHRLPPLTYLNFYLRTKFYPYNLIYSSLKNRKWGAEATMQMNHYNTKALFNLFSEYTDQVHVEFTDHGGHLGAFYLFRKNKERHG
ncbi:class I SAM-dependent methyltransferase [Negadavirga shengliensis]|uniref:Class I SAM-dependent methyltransferase n=1 Tax=Negadavirga shengliensis TaxID=1389218 RepID=A0ABV9SXK2_9BACT